MDIIQRILEKDNSTREVRTHEDREEFERQVIGLVDLYDFLDAHPDEVTKKALKFMPPVDTLVLTETVKRIRLRDGDTLKENKKN